MSRSFKKTPIQAIAGDSDKRGKRAANRKLRRVSKQAISSGKQPPELREVSDVWDMDKDGKSYVGGVIRK